MTRKTKRTLWLLIAVAFAIPAVLGWSQVARNGLTFGPGFVALCASMIAVFAFLGWSQQPHED